MNEAMMSAFKHGSDCKDAFILKSCEDLDFIKRLQFHELSLRRLLISVEFEKYKS